MPYFDGFDKDRVFKYLFKLQVSDNAPNMLNSGIYVQKRFWTYTRGSRSYCS